jgi:hypothetical protein
MILYIKVGLVMASIVRTYIVHHTLLHDKKNGYMYDTINTYMYMAQHTI